jgi:hypothetical protein
VLLVVCRVQYPGERHRIVVEVEDLLTTRATAADVVGGPVLLALVQ